MHTHLTRFRSLTTVSCALLLIGCGSGGTPVDPTPPPPPLPQQILSCETNTATLCSAWQRQGEQYTASWSDGAQAVIQVARFGADSVRFTRTDHTGKSAGMTAVYRGVVSGNGVPTGFVTWTQNGMSWSGQWSATW